MNALGLGLIATFCWGLHDIAVRYLNRTVPLHGALLVVLATGMVFQFSILTVADGLTVPGGSSLWYAIGSGLAYLVAGLTLYCAFKRGPVRLVSPIIGAYPVFSITLARMPRLQWAGSCTAFAGIGYLAL